MKPWGALSELRTWGGGEGGVGPAPVSPWYRLLERKVLFALFVLINC